MFSTKRDNISRSLWFLLAVWSFLEASVWFIAPDFLLVIFGIFFPREWTRSTALALLSSLIGGVFYFTLLQSQPEFFGSLLQRTPFVTDRMLKFVNDLYARHQYLGVLFQSFSFMSFKIWTYQAIKFHFNPALYFPLVMLSRTVRLGAVAYLASRISPFIYSHVVRHPKVWIGVYSFLFLAGLILIES